LLVCPGHYEKSSKKQACGKRLHSAAADLTIKIIIIIFKLICNKAPKSRTGKKTEKITQAGNFRAPDKLQEMPNTKGVLLAVFLVLVHKLFILIRNLE